jgi:A/G-specific adenine glycosylase
VHSAGGQWRKLIALVPARSDPTLESDTILASAVKDSKVRFSTPQPSLFRARLLAWYQTHARRLPWRENRDPYRIWVSEIMLQQTRVAAVIEHYHEFLRRFPTVEKLAAAREATVLAAWSGLGYYRRARMLHRAAKEIVRGPGGQFPGTAEAWRELPGIGRYTAAAIASIASDEPVAVVDGNVERVLQRVSAGQWAGEDLWRAAQELLDRDHPGDFNQAMMELGATVCTARAPACLTCPVVKLCATRGEMARTAKAPQQKKREIHYALHGRDGRVFLVQRPHEASLMAGMWELPEVDAADAAVFGRAGKHVPRFAPNDRIRSKDRTPLFTLRHSITVTDYTVRVWRGIPRGQAPGKWVALRQLQKLALTGVTRKILMQAGMMSEVEKRAPQVSGRRRLFASSKIDD